MPPMGAGPAITYRPVMIFIDGGYLRSSLKEMFDTDQIDFKGLTYLITGLWSWGTVHGEFVRAYYYDAIVAPRDEEFDEQNAYVDEIRNCEGYEVRLGRLVKSSGGYRQKGVGILMTLDMITKAFLNHYEIAYLLAGDDDFVDLVQSVKALTGKRIYIVYFSKHMSKRLKECFDYRTELDSSQYLNAVRNLMRK
jgi:uncharacterized LabA/DUF88 family protein